MAAEVTFDPISRYAATRTLSTMADEALRGAIFIDDFIDLPLPFEAIRERFARAGEGLNDSARRAEADGEALYLQMGPTWGGGFVSREVEVILGPTHERGEARVVPLAWRSTGHAGIFPMLDGDLELAPLSSHECRLTLAGSYVAPFGDLGRALDRAVLHRVAQSTVRSFLTQVAESLKAGDGDPASPFPHTPETHG